MNALARALLRRPLQHLRTTPAGILALIVLLGGLATTLAAWQISVENNLAAANARFDGMANQIATIVQRRMVAHEQILRGAAALFKLKESVSREQWRTYVSGLKLEENYPGILGVGFIQRVAAADKDRHVREVRAEGFPEYQVLPDSPREEYNATIYLEPFWGRNLRAFGYDMATEAAPREAMNRARDSGSPALSGRVTLVQEARQDVQPGFMLFLPVYRGDLPTASVAERRAALVGYVYSPFRSRDLMGSLLAGNFDAGIAVELYAAPTPAADALLHASAPGTETRASRFHARTRLHVAGTDWTLAFSSLPEFEAEFAQGRNHLILGTGLVLSLALSLLVWNLVAVRNRAFATASRATNQLSYSQTRLRAVLDSAADGILGLAADGRIESANSAAEHIFGLPAGGARGKSVEALIEGCDLARLDHLLAEQGLASESGASTRFEAQGLRAGGQQFPVAVSLSRFDLGEAAYYSLIIRDITEARLAESMLKLRERAIEASSNGIVIVDMVLPGQPVIYANPAFERITGYGTDEIVGRNCALLQGNDRDQPAVDELRRAIAEKRPCQVLLRNYRKDGTLFWNELAIAPVFDTSGQVTHFVGIQNDITERVRAEADLHARTQRLDAVFKLSPDGFVAFDASGMLTNVNPAFLDMTGFTEQDLLGIHAEVFDARMQGLCASGHPTVRTLDALDAAGGDGSQQAMLTLVRPQARILRRALRIADVGSGEQVVYFRDVTRETEVDRMKSEFLSTAAHELRTPLSSIFGFSELMLNWPFEDGRRVQMLGTIHRQAGILVKLINELLDLARIEARAGKDFSYRAQPLAPVLESAVSGLLIGNDARRVELRIPEDLPLVRIDETKLAQSLTNVLSNAYKYSPAGGAIELSVVTTGADRDARVGVRVRDHGIGMTREQLQRVFERFYRADPSGNIPGTGLGMCLVKEIIELHGGSVDVASEFGAGTTVTLWLPVAGAEELRLAA